MHWQVSAQQKAQAAKDYQQSLRLSAREEWDTDAENEEDGATRNPYAAWEWASQLRSSGDIVGAAQKHQLAAEAFDDIGDKPRSVMALYDVGIDLAALSGSKYNKEAKDTITSAIQNMKKIEGGQMILFGPVFWD